MVASKSPQTHAHIEEFCSRAIRALDRPPGTNPATATGTTGGSTAKGGAGGGKPKGERLRNFETTLFFPGNWF